MVPRQVAALLSLGPRSLPLSSAGSESEPNSADTGTTVDITTPNDPLDVCLLSYRSDPYSGGQGVYIKYLSRALVDLGHNVTVVSGKPYPDLDPVVELVRLPGENVVDETDRIRAFKLNYLQNPTKLFEWMSVVTGGFPDPYTFGKRALDYIQNHGYKFDIVHDNQSLAYALLDMELPIVTTIHHPITADREIDLRTANGLTERVLTRRWYRFLRMQREVAAELTHVISVSEATKHRTVADFGTDPDAISVIRNGIDTGQFSPRDVPQQPKRIMTTVSADVPLKGTRYLLKAFAMVREHHPDSELSVVGEFDDGGTAERLTKRLNIDHAIKTHGKITTERMVELYGSATVAVVPSLYEGFGLPAAEAMACGVPVVATTGGALPEVVGNAGRLVPPGDAEALSDAVSDLLADPVSRDRLRRRGRHRVTTEFDWSEAAEQTVDVYRQAINAHR